jgi:hypothetical protein
MAGSRRFRTIQVCPKDLRVLPGHPELAVSWHSGFRGGAFFGMSPNARVIGFACWAGGPDAHDAGRPCRRTEPPRARIARHGYTFRIDKCPSATCVGRRNNRVPIGGRPRKQGAARLVAAGHDPCIATQTPSNRVAVTSLRFLPLRMAD